MRKTTLLLILITLFVAGTACSKDEGCGPDIKTANEPECTPVPPDNLLPWSKPAGGLVGRIEGFSHSWAGSIIVYVRLYNASGKVIKLPDYEFLSRKAPKYFRLHGEVSGEWTDGSLSGMFSSKTSDVPSQDKCTELTPGEGMLVRVCGYAPGLVWDRWERMPKIKAVFEVDEGSRMWSGTLETPEVSTSETHANLEGKLPFPDYCPGFSNESVVIPCSPMPKPHRNHWRAIESFRLANSLLLRLINLYNREGTLR